MYDYVYNDNVASSCIYGKDFVRDLLASNYQSNIYVPKVDIPVSSKKLEGFLRLAEYRDYY